MNKDQAKALGKLLQAKRTELGYSTREVADAAGVTQSTVVRFEQGKFAAPRPNRLARFAQLLGLSLADLYARAGYLVPDDLPSFEAYLQAKYPGLPNSAVAELRKHFLAVVKQHDPATTEQTNDTKWRRAP